tara:strand:+ start:844 stop:1008 length:165 start_codon:yes stop_codon:yes gene_type:complete
LKLIIWSLLIDLAAEHLEIKDEVKFINGLNGSVEYDFSKAELFPSMRDVKQQYR